MILLKWCGFILIWLCKLFFIDDINILVPKKKKIPLVKIHLDAHHFFYFVSELTFLTIVIRGSAWDALINKTVCHNPGIVSNHGTVVCDITWQDYVAAIYAVFVREYSQKPYLLNDIQKFPF